MNDELKSKRKLERGFTLIERIRADRDFLGLEKSNSE